MGSTVYAVGEWPEEIAKLAKAHRVDGMRCEFAAVVPNGVHVPPTFEEDSNFWSGKLTVPFGDGGRLVFGLVRVEL